MVNRAIKLRMYPTAEQAERLPQMFGNARFVYNHLLAYQQWRYRHGWKHLGQYAMNNAIARLKKHQRYTWLKRSESTSLQLVSFNLHRAYQAFFHHQSGLPMFKKRTHSQAYSSKNVNHNIHVVDKRHIKMPKLGNLCCQHIYHFDGKIKQATVELKPTGKYYLVLIVYTDVTKMNQTGRSIGIDLGLRNFANLSNGRKYRALRFRGLEDKLRIWQRKYARRRINAKCIQREAEHLNEKRLVPKDVRPWFLHPRVIFARQRVAWIHAKMAARRADFLQKLSTALVKSYDMIAMEDLKTKNLQSNHHLAKAIGQQGWRMFREMLTYKCQWYGKTLKIVKPNNTTQTCSDCGYQMNEHGHKIKLGVERWRCPHCHTRHDRDHNAAINILATPAEETIK